MKFTPGGIPMTNFSLAAKETYKNGGGEKKTRTLWIRCVAWRRWAGIAGGFVGKGKFLFVEGRLQLRSYEDREGQKRSVTEVVVTSLRFLGPPKNGNGATAAESSKPAEPVDESDNPFNEPGRETTDQEIPFWGCPRKCPYFASCRMRRSSGWTDWDESPAPTSPFGKSQTPKNGGLRQPANGWEGRCALEYSVKQRVVGSDDGGHPLRVVPRCHLSRVAVWAEMTESFP